MKKLNYLVLENVDEIEEQLSHFIKENRFDKHNIEIITHVHTIKKETPEFSNLVDKLKACDILLIQSTFSNYDQFSLFLKLLYSFQKPKTIYILHTNQKLEHFLVSLEPEDKKTLIELLKTSSVYNVLYQSFAEKGEYFDRISYVFDSVPVRYEKQIDLFINVRRTSFPMLYEKYLQQDTIHIDKNSNVVVVPKDYEVILLNKKDKETLKTLLNEVKLREEAYLEDFEHGIMHMIFDEDERKVIVKEKRSWLKLIEKINL